MISTLVKPASANCNLDCLYCFYHDRPTDPYSDVPRRIMEDYILSSFVSQYMKLSDPASFCWQGGEPLLTGLDFFKRVVELQMKYGKSGQSVSNSIQTNGITIDESWAKFFREYNFLIGLSLDGPEEYNDFYRKFPSSKGSFNRIMETVLILREHKVEFNILSVVTSLTESKADELYDFFLSEGFYYLQFIPCIEPDPASGGMADFSVTPEGYGRFLCRLFDLWYNGGRPQVSIRLFDNTLQAYLKMEPESCSFRKRCGEYFVVEYNGDIYPCDFFVEKQWLLGNLTERPIEEIIRSDKFRKFSSIKLGPYEECSSCRWNFICRNSCPRSRYVSNGDFDFGSRDYLCESFRMFFEHSSSRFIKLRDQLTKRSVVERNLSTGMYGNVGRNDPCPCGSGKKFKKCCMPYIRELNPVK